MSVKKYKPFYGSNDIGPFVALKEEEDGLCVLSSDYDELRERVAWMIECQEFLESVDENDKVMMLVASIYCQDSREAVEEML